MPLDGVVPDVLVETKDMPEKEWLEWRRKGIGGSDAAAVLGISPWRTARDLYYDKRGIVTLDNKDNWVQLEVGHLLEPLVAQIFERKTGLKVSKLEFMFQHHEHPWMLADIDYLVTFPDYSNGILEIKTTNYNAKDKWWYNGEEIVPPYYEAQGRHYMAVMNIDRVYFCCLYGNNEEEVIIRKIDRDMAYEEELIAAEEDFWMNYVQKEVPPPFTENDGDLILDTLERSIGPADVDAPAVLLEKGQAEQIDAFLALQEQKSRLNAEVNRIDKEMKRLQGLVVVKLGQSCTGIYTKGGETYTVTYNPTRRSSILKDELALLKMEHPDIFNKYVTVSFGRRFNVKISQAAQQAA